MRGDHRAQTIVVLYQQNSHALMWPSKGGKKSKHFFFEKKKQKTFKSGAGGRRT
jgi:hypothetical protein